MGEAELELALQGFEAPREEQHDYNGLQHDYNCNSVHG